LGAKHGFCYRRLVQWFKRDGRYAEYETVTKQNAHASAAQPMGEAKLKISGIKVVGWVNGRKFETRNGVINAILLYRPHHHEANSQGYVYEHRLIMEQELGRPLLEAEVVHHIDLDPTNNDPDNLIVLDNDSEHGRVHAYLQLALVQLMPSKDLRRLTEQIIVHIRANAPRGKKRSKKRSKIKVETSVS